MGCGLCGRGLGPQRETSSMPIPPTLCLPHTWDAEQRVWGASHSPIWWHLDPGARQVLRRANECSRTRRPPPCGRLESVEGHPLGAPREGGRADPREGGSLGKTVMVTPLVMGSHAQRLRASPSSVSRPVAGRTARWQVDKEQHLPPTAPCGRPRAPVSCRASPGHLCVREPCLLTPLPTCPSPAP